MPAPVTVDFYFSPASPFAYLASTQMLALQLETGARVDWYPVWTRRLIELAGFDFTKARGSSGAAEPDYRAEDTARWARLYKVPFRGYSPVQVPDPRVLALACTAARRFDAGQVFARALMKAIFADGRGPADADLCAEIANDTAGIEPHLFRPCMEEAETEAILYGIIDQAVADGCFGVPSFVVKSADGRRQRIYGNDRLPLLRQAIAELKQPS